jgi:Suppressor of fused protein (SUFU)
MMFGMTNPADFDPILLDRTVLDNYLNWLGQPARAMQPSARNASFSKDFKLLVYPRDGYDLLATLGASHTPMPGSLPASPETGGIRQEYLLHAPHGQTEAYATALIGLASLPFAVNAPLAPGVSVSVGSDLLSQGGFSQVYLTLPYKDDPGDAASGAFRNATTFVQTLWAVPLRDAEAASLSTSGAQALGQNIQQPGFEAWNPARPDLV